MANETTGSDNTTTTKTFNDVKLHIHFTPASSRTSITSGDNIASTVATLSKVITDLEEADAFTKKVVDSSLSDTSTNPVQNKVLNSALSNKVNSSDIVRISEDDINSICYIADAEI